MLYNLSKDKFRYLPGFKDILIINAVRIGNWWQALYFVLFLNTK